MNVNVFASELRPDNLETISSKKTLKLDDESNIITDAEEVTNAILSERDVNGKLSESDRKSIIENSSSEALNEFYDIAINETSEKIEEEGLYLPAEGIVKKTYTLDCGEVVTITLDDEKSDMISSIKRLFVDEVYASMIRPENTYKKYGTYTFTATYSFSMLGRLVLKEKVKYNISSSGLTLKSHSASASPGSLIIRFDKCYSKANNSTAKTVNKYIQEQDITLFIGKLTV